MADRLPHTIHTRKEVGSTSTACHSMQVRNLASCSSTLVARVHLRTPVRLLPVRPSNSARNLDRSTRLSPDKCSSISPTRSNNPDHHMLQTHSTIVHCQMLGILHHRAGSNHNHSAYRLAPILITPISIDNHLTRPAILGSSTGHNRCSRTLSTHPKAFRTRTRKVKHSISKHDNRNLAQVQGPDPVPSQGRCTRRSLNRAMVHHRRKATADPCRLSRHHTRTTAESLRSLPASASP